MNKGAIIFLIVVVASIGTSWYMANQLQITDDSDSHYFPRKSPLILPNLQPLVSVNNLSRGMTLTCNFTIYKFTDKELVIPLDFVLYKIVNGSGHEIIASEVGFYDYYAPTVFILDSNRIMSSLITLEISEDVEVSEYQLFLRTGNWEETNVSGATLNFRVVE